MASYAEVADFAIYGLRAEVTADIDPAVILAHLTNASRVADSYIGNRGYPLPLTAWGDDLRAAVCRIAAWTVLVFKGTTPDEPTAMSVSKSRDDAIAWLRDVAKGVANLDLVTTTPARGSNGMISLITSDEPSRGW